MKPASNPDLDWYLNTSISVRSAFGAHSRPLNVVRGIMTVYPGLGRIPRNEVERLNRKWENSELRSWTADQAPHIIGNGDERSFIQQVLP